MVASELDAGIARLLRGVPEVAAAWLFGSMARGEPSSESDLDLALLLHRRGLTARDVYEPLGRLAAQLESAASGRKIDLVLIESQGPVFQHRVLREGQLVHDADARRRVDFESDAYVRCFDFRPTHDLAERDAWAAKCQLRAS